LAKLLQGPFQSLDRRRRNGVVLDSRGVLEKDGIPISPVPYWLSPLDFAYLPIDENPVAHFEERFLALHTSFWHFSIP